MRFFFIRPPELRIRLNYPPRPKFSGFQIIEGNIPPLGKKLFKGFFLSVVYLSNSRGDFPSFWSDCILKQPGVKVGFGNFFAFS